MHARRTLAALVALALAGGLAVAAYAGPAPTTAAPVAAVGASIPPATPVAPPTAPTTIATPTTTAAPVATAKPAKPARAAESATRKPRNNAERDWACDQGTDGVPVCEGNVPASVGKYRTPAQYRAWQRKQAEREFAPEGEAALAACTRQTGMTRKQCLADAAAGNAS